MKLFFYIFICGILILSIHNSLFAQNNNASFATPSSLPRLIADIKTEPLKLISFQASLNNNKVTLKWVVSENEAVDQFEVEKSSDGKNFKIAALVFGTDKPETDSYMFYEKAVAKKVIYRIKIIDKKGEITYSETREI